MKRNLILFLLLFMALAALAQDAGTLTLDRIFASNDFGSEYFGGARWLSDGTGYELVSTSVVPIPAAVWLFGSGLLGLIGVARRKARA